jgi:glycosyltransferase involved in cell wall biosynthesis
MLSLLLPCVITLHEISQQHILKQISLLPFSMRSLHVIFTNIYEQNFALRWVPWIRNRSSVIPIGSYIGVTDHEGHRDVEEIVNFGLIRPNKGLEDVLALAALSQKQKLNFRFRILGKPLPKYMGYFLSLQNQSISLPITWDIGLSESAIAQLLSRSRVAYMPFPDGASERRSSLLALLANGVATITTRGMHTPPTLDDAVYYVRGPEQAMLAIQKINSDRDLRARLSKNGRIFANGYTWETIAARHIALYKKILESWQYQH